MTANPVNRSTEALFSIINRAATDTTVARRVLNNANVIGEVLTRNRVPKKSIADTHRMALAMPNQGTAFFDDVAAADDDDDDESKVVYSSRIVGNSKNIAGINRIKAAQRMAGAYTALIGTLLLCVKYVE